MPRPYPLPETDRIPEELRQLPRWVCWQADPENGKVPKNARTGGNAQCNNPATWSTFEDAEAALNNGHNFHGLSFALNGDGIDGIDLDHCRDPKTKVISDVAARVVARFNTHTEVTPSGTGVRMFLRGDLPKGWRKRDKVEVYGDRKFLSVTGHVLSGYGAGHGIA